MLTQLDIVEQRQHGDAVSYGGWAIDVHPPEGVFSKEPGCSQWHSKGVYQIPYRCFYSRNLSNLFFAGRNISASHVAFASTRVMATCAHGAQAVGMAAALCVQRGLKPRDLSNGANIGDLQQALLRAGQFIPGTVLNDPADLAREAKLSASSELRLSTLDASGQTLPLTYCWAMMLPVQSGPMPRVSFLLDVARATELKAELRVSSKAENHTPDVTLASLSIPLAAGAGQTVALPFEAAIDGPRYAFVCLRTNDDISVHLSGQRLTGVLALIHKANHAVAKSARQEAPGEIGIESFDFWTPQRRPEGKNFAIKVEPPLEVFGAANLTNGMARPTRQPNAWVASFEDAAPWVRLSWPKPRSIKRIELVFDTDFDHPMESVLMGHPENEMPFCVPEFSVSDDTGRVLGESRDNHQSRRTICLETPVRTASLRIALAGRGNGIPAALFEVRCYEQ